MDQDVDIAQKTGTRVSQALGIGLISLAGLGAAAAFLFFGSSIKQPLTLSSTTIQTTSTTSTATPTDLSKATLPPAESFTSNLASASVGTVALDPSVSVSITSPAEGAIINGGTPVTISLTDPGHKATHVRVLLSGTSMPAYLQGESLGNYPTSGTGTYTVSVAYVMYPSGENKYVAQAINVAADGAITVLAQTDVMATWARTCYWLAYQDMTLTAPTTSVTAGSSFTMTTTVTNHQRGACDHKYLVDTQNMFMTDSLLPSGWTATVSPATTDSLKGIYGLPLGIEETKTFTITVQVPASTAAGAYQVGATSRLIYTGFVVTKNASVNVVAASGGSGGGEGIIIPKKVQ